MVLLEKYTTLNRVLFLLKIQVVDSLAFAEKTCPRFDTPKQLWDWLKPRLHFEDDELGYEDLQSMQTLFLRRGRGDCDCFVITTIACMIVNGFDNIYVDLAGYSKKNPTHIYTDIIVNGQKIVMDFTNPKYNMERTHGPKGRYKYRQRLPVKWRNW